MPGALHGIEPASTGEGALAAPIANCHCRRWSRCRGKAWRRNALRQDEIIEEIEVILLSSETVGAPDGY